MQYLVLGAREGVQKVLGVGAALSRIQRSVPSWRVKVMLFDFETSAAVVAAYYCDGTKLPPGERLPLADLGAIAGLRPDELADARCRPDSTHGDDGLVGDARNIVCDWIGAAHGL